MRRDWHLSRIYSHTPSKRPRKRGKAFAKFSRVDDDKIFTNRVLFECEVRFYRCLKKHSNISLTTFYYGSNCSRGFRVVFQDFFFVFVSCASSRRAILPIIDLAGTAFHSSQNVINDDVTRIMPGMKKVVK